MNDKRYRPQFAGESKFDLDTLSAAISSAKDALAANEEECIECERQKSKQSELMDGLDEAYNRFRSFAEMFEDASPEARKMIVCQIVNRVEVGKGYHLTVRINPTYEQFLGEETG